MFSTQYEAAWEQITDLRQQRAGAPATLRPQAASDFLPLLWEEEFGTGGAWTAPFLAALPRASRLYTATGSLPSCRFT